MIVNEHGLNWYHLSPRFPMKNVIVNVYGGFEWQRQFRHLSRMKLTSSFSFEASLRIQVHSIRRNSFESYQSEATPYRKTLQAGDLSCAIRSCLVSMVPPLHRDLRLLRLLLSTSPRVIRLRHLLMRKNVQLNSHRTVTKIFAGTTASASHSCTQKRRSCLKKELPRFRGPAP